MAPRRDELPGFRVVALSIWEHEPATSNEKIMDGTEEHRSSPDLILIFSWTGALLRHVSKYTQHYERLYPASTIMLITTTIKDLCVRSSGQKQARLKLGVQRVVQSFKDKRILVHCFSEGGSNKAVEFAEAYHNSAGEKLPVQALCLDSTPGHPRFQKLCGAFSRSLGPNKAVRAVGLVIGTVVLGTFWFAYTAIKGRENNVITKTRARINDEKFWNVNAPRCYMYSEADDMIHWKDIKEHLDDAAKEGTPVCAMQFANSGHCRHVEMANDAYWEAVVETWAKGDPRKQKPGRRITTIFSDRHARGTSLLFSIDSTTEVASHLSIPAEKEAFKRLSSNIIFNGSPMTLDSQSLLAPPRKSSTVYRASLDPDNDNHRRPSIMLERYSEQSSLPPSPPPPPPPLSHRDPITTGSQRPLDFGKASLSKTQSRTQYSTAQSPLQQRKQTFEVAAPLQESTQASNRQFLAAGRKSTVGPNGRESTVDPLMMYLSIRDY